MDIPRELIGILHRGCTTQAMLPTTSATLSGTMRKDSVAFGSSMEVLVALMFDVLHYLYLYAVGDTLQFGI